MTQVELIARLLRDAEKAHAEYEKKETGEKKEWPEFYASYLIHELYALAAIR